MRRTRSRKHAVAAAAALVLALPACSGGGGGGDIVGRDAAAGGSEAADAAPPQPEEYASVPVPGPPLDASSLRGQTVYWIPITSAAPVFTVEQRAATEAFASVGIVLQLCDGEATPDVVGRCVGQAVAAGAAGIIATSIPPEFARQAFNGAVEAGIPLLFVNTQDASTPPEWGELAAALPHNFDAQAELNNDLIIADSGGDGRVLLVGVQDSSVTTSLYERGMHGYLTENCPDCSVESVQTSRREIANLPSLVSTALVRNPDIEYVFVEFDAFAAPVVQAIRQLNRQADIKLLTLLGQLDGLQRVAEGQAMADTGYSLAALGWNQADILLRMMLGQDPLVEAHRTPIRTFTRATVEGLDLSQDGWQSGAWQSEDDFRAMYRELWSASS